MAKVDRRIGEIDGLMHVTSCFSFDLIGKELFNLIIVTK